MSNGQIVNLGDCTDFRRALELRLARPIHATVFVLLALVVVSLLWAHYTKAKIIVRAAGRLRPQTVPVRVLNASSGESFSVSVGATVTAVHHKEGDSVTAGEILVQCDTARVDHEVSRKEQGLSAAEDELRRLEELTRLTARQFAAAISKAKAELAQAAAVLERERELRDSQLRQRKAKFDAAKEEHERYELLVKRNVATAGELRKVEVELREAEEAYRQADLPLDEHKVEVATKAMESLEEDQAVKIAELEIRRNSRKTEIGSLRVELAKLRLERDQATLRAPISGVIIQGDIQVGDTIERGKTVFEIAPSGRLIFEGMVPAADIGDVKVQLPVELKIDAFDYQQYGIVKGEVQFVSPDSKTTGSPASGSGGAGALSDGKGPPAFTCRVELASETVGRGDKIGLLKLGMTGRADIVTGEHSLLEILVKRIRHAISLG